MNSYWGDLGVGYYVLLLWVGVDRLLWWLSPC